MQWTWIVLGIVALLILALIGTYNGLVARRQRVRDAWANVDTELRRRLDLIPNVVETVKGFAAQERGVFDGIAQARAKMAGAQTPADKIAASNEERSALSRLLLVVENYPQLKSDQNFLRLQDDLSGTENRLAVARMRYNEQVQAYNTLRNQFPSNMTGKLFGFKAEYPYFEAPADSKAAPKVDFGK